MAEHIGLAQEIVVDVVGVRSGIAERICFGYHVAAVVIVENRRPSKHVSNYFPVVP